MKKRLLAILMVIALTAGMIVPGSAFAEDRNGWVTAADGSRYYYQDGVKAVGAKSISGVVYVFETNGRLHNKEGLFGVNGKEYCLTPGGIAKTGFVIFKENKKEKAAYFDRSSGEMLKGRMVGYLRLPNSGRLNAAYVRGIKFLNKHGWNLKRAFFAVVKKTKYAYRRMRRKNIETYANFGFRKHKGNCYVFAGQFYVCAKLLGYDVKMWQGYVNDKKHPHSWCSIKNAAGKTLIYDPSFEDHGRKKKSPSGYMLKEGSKGTWRYLKKRKKVKSIY